MNDRTTQLLLAATFCFSFLSNTCFAGEVFDSRLEVPTLQNIQQLTFPSMGFEKAGEAYFSPDSQTIIFQAVPEGKDQYQIYTLHIGEETPHLVSTGEGACTCAYFRPDGQKIIFASSHSASTANKYKWDLTSYMNIYEANPDGTDLVPLTQGPAYHAECAYSPDGSKIVYASNQSGSMNIYTMDADGSNVFQVTTNDDCYNGGPFFSPDGNKIIFRADRDRPDYLQVYVINADGSEEQQLTANHAVNWAPYWHPNGKIIAFTTSLHGHQHYEIYLMNIENGALSRLTHNASFDGLPSFNREGTKILWTSKRGSDDTCQVFIADFVIPDQLN